ncbi:MAG: MoaD/ThiS family protein [Chloroflexota bacterium]
MSVNIKIPVMFQNETKGVKLVEVNGSTVGECLTELIKLHPPVEKVLFDSHAQLTEWLVIIVNGEALPEDNRLAVPVKDGDEIYPMMMLGGG